MGKEFREGQVWKYNNREFEKDSRAIILLVEKYEKLDVTHVAVSNLKIKNPSPNGEPIHTITHMPFSKEAIESSLTVLEGVTDISNFSEGYTSWKNGYDSGKAGVFTVSVGEAVVYMETTLNEGS